MVDLLKNQQKDMAAEAGPRPPMVREINVEIWANVNIEYRGKSFPTGSIALLYARKERFSRDFTGDAKDVQWAFLFNPDGSVFETAMGTRSPRYSYT